MMHTLIADARLAARLLVKDKWFTLAAVAALALGIAATNTVFTIVNGVLLRDLPFDDPDRIVSVGVSNAPGAPNALSGVSYADVLDWRTAVRTFDGISAFTEQTMNVSEEGRAPEQFRGAFISGNAFPLIGARPILGRDFRADDDRDGAAPVVILGHDVWRNRYESSPEVIGRAIRVNGVASTVIGVMPEGFLFPQRSFLWQPLAALEAESKADRGSRYLGAFGRMKAGVTREQADADLQSVTSVLAARYPTTNARIQAGTATFRSGVGGPIRALLVSMMGAVGFVLLIACANVANLLLSRAGGRAREVSVRMAVGAGRWRIVRQLLVESLLLAIIAGIVGLGLSMAGIRLFWATASETNPPYWLQFPIDLRVFGFLAAICLGTAIVFGLAPALYTTRTNLAEVLSDAGRTSAGRRGGARWSGILVAGQLALALVLLTGAGLMIRNLLILSTMEAGVDTSTLIRARVDLPAPAYGSEQRRLSIYRQLEERLTSAPGLRGALATAIPLVGGAGRDVVIDGRPVPEPSARPRTTTLTVGTNYFELLGIRVSGGRTFTDGEGGPGRGVAVVNERFAAMNFPGENPIGRRIQFPSGEPSNDRRPAPEWMTIVGVVQNVRQRPPQDGGFDPVVYTPFAGSVAFFTNILIREPSDPTLAAALLREQLGAIDRELPIFDVQRVDAFIYTQRWAQRVFGSMFAIFGGIALVLATVGLYAVTAYGVARRTREIGVRVALGAQAGDVWWLVTRAASWQLGAGLLIGIAGSIAVSRTVPSAITQANGTDPITLGVATLSLLAVALVACLIPSRRAMRLNPISALRSE
jgi:putative ABC transport system permease protein